MAAVGVLKENSEQRSFHPFLFSRRRIFLHCMFPRLKMSQLSRDGQALYKRSRIRRDSTASSHVEFHQGKDNFLDDVNFFLGGKIPWGKNGEILSERKEQNFSYISKGFNGIAEKEIKE